MQSVAVIASDSLFRLYRIASNEPVWILVPVAVLRVHEHNRAHLAVVEVAVEVLRDLRIQGVAVVLHETEEESGMRYDGDVLLWARHEPCSKLARACLNLFVGFSLILAPVHILRVLYQGEVDSREVSFCVTDRAPAVARMDSERLSAQLARDDRRNALRRHRHMLRADAAFVALRQHEGRVRAAVHVGRTCEAADCRLESSYQRGHDDQVNRDVVADNVLIKRMRLRPSLFSQMRIKKRPFFVVFVHDDLVVKAFPVANQMHNL